MTLRAHRLVAAGALAVAAVAAPLAIALSGAATQTVAGPACLSWYGNKDDGVCLSYSNGNGVNLGTVASGEYGPYGGGGISTSPLLPGRTYTSPAG